MRWLFRGTAWALGIFALVVVAYRVIPPPVTPLMLRNAWAYGITKDWVPLDAMSPALVGKSWTDGTSDSLYQNKTEVYAGTNSLTLDTEGSGTMNLVEGVRSRGKSAC